MEGLQMSNSIKHLKQLEVQARAAKSPSMPIAYIIPTKYNDKTANGLTKAIIDWLNLNGCQGERINSTGRQIDNRKVVSDSMGFKKTIGSIKWIKGSGTNGTADISATIKARSVKIEIKIGLDRQSQAQKEYQKSVESAGGIYIVAKDFQGFYDWFHQFILKFA
jgi:hypothetical protein